MKNQFEIHAIFYEYLDLDQLIYHEEQYQNKNLEL